MKSSHSRLSKTKIEKNEEHSKNKSFSTGTKKVIIGNSGGRKQWLSKTMCEPNFSCAFCNATFVRIDSMQSHLRQHQKLQPELEEEIFALQQQLQQQHQSNQHQPTIHFVSKKQNESNSDKNITYTSHVVSTNTAKSKSFSNESFQQNKKSNPKTDITNVNRKLDDIPSSLNLTPDTLSSSSITSDLVMSQDSNQGPITLIVSPEKIAKSSSTLVHNELQQISPSHLQGISYLAVSPTSSAAERNITTLSVPVASTPQTISTKPARQSTSPLNTITLIQQPNGQVNLFEKFYRH